MRRLLVTAICVAAFPPLAVAQTGDGPRSQSATPEEPFGDPAAGRPLPSGAFARLGSPRLRTRTDYANGMQFSPDGRRLIVAAGRDDLWWFDLAAGRTQHRHEYPVRSIKCGRLLDDGTLVLFHSRGVGDKETYFVMRFDPATGKVVSDVPVDLHEADEAAFDAVATAVAAVREKTVTVFDAKTGTRRWSLTLDQKPPGAPAFFPDGSKLVLFAGGQVSIHDAKTAAVIQKLEVPGEIRNVSTDPHVVTVTPDGRHVASAGAGDRGFVWDATTGKLLHRLTNCRRPLGFTPDGRLFAAGTRDTLNVCNATTGKVEAEHPFRNPDKATLSPDGKRLAVVLQDTVLVYDVPASGPPVLSPITADLPGLPDELRFDADGTLVGRLRGWNAWAMWKDRKPQPQLLPTPRDIAFGLSADRTVSLAMKDNHLLVFGPAGVTATFTREDKLPPLGSDLSADGRTVVVAHDEGLTRFDVPTKTSTLLRSRFKNRGAGSGAMISADSRTAITEGYDPVTDARYVEVFSLVTNKPVREVPITGPLDRAAVTPDGRRVAVAYISNSPQRNLEKNLHVFDPDTGHTLLKLGPMAKGEDLRLALAPDGRTVAWLMSSELRVYELITGSLRAKLPTPKNDLHAVALAADGRTLAAAAPGWPVVLWDIGGGTTYTPLTDAEWDAAWGVLTKPDAASAYYAARRMALSPAEAVTFLKGKLTPVAPPAADVLARLIGRLDAPAFAERQAAAKELRNLGELAEPALKRTLATTDSAETRQRIEGLLTTIRKPSPEVVRAARGIELLEWVGTADAKAVVKTLAGGAEGARQTQEAAAALARMK